MFEPLGFQKELENLPMSDPPQLQAVDVNGICSDAFRQKIPFIDSMSDHDLTILIKNNIDFIETDIIQGDNSYSPALVNPKFINALVRVINSIPVDSKLKLAINKITYDYLTSDTPDSEIKRQYLQMARAVNSRDINQLVAIGLSEPIACNLSLCRYSSSNEITNVKRLNFAICNRSSEIMTEQMVVWIYEKLFDAIRDLFMGIMFEVYSDQQFNDFGEEFTEVYGTVGLALLIIVNNMKTDDIRKLLMLYYNEWSYRGRPPVRFSLHALSEDYSRITRVIEYLHDVEGVSIP